MYSCRGRVTTRTFRKTAATLLDDSGLTVREIADQLGHKRVSMTQDVYFGRNQGSPTVAHALGVIDEADPNSEREPVPDAADPVETGR